MADIFKYIILQTNENLTENVSNSTKVPSTPEGMAVAYGSLVIMALFPIFFGAFRSVKYHKEQKAAGETPESMSSKDAALFPFIASIALFVLYLVFRFFPKEYINLLLTGYFFLLGVLALTHLFSPLVNSLVPSTIPNFPYHILFKKGEGDNAVNIINYKFTTYDLISLFLCSIFGVWYLYEKHWIANNLFGIAFAINGVELLHLNNIVTGCILLCGLFVYDIFWVFGTNVMVTVAKSFEAPIKLVFPQDILVNGFGASNFAMLGLGDIVIPGIFIALLLRFDKSLNRGSNTYFNATFIAYILGLLATIFVMHAFKHAQPALLYLVPACLCTPLLLALIKGDIKAMFLYEDHPPKTEEQKSESDEKVNEIENKKSK